MTDTAARPTTLRADVAIVGGGLMGLWSAYFLRKHGRSVVVLEKGVVGAQASGVNFGNVRLQGRYPGQYPLALRAHALWEQLDALIGDTCEFTPCGHLYLALGAKDEGKLEDYNREANDAGVAAELLGGNAARQRWPWLSALVSAASFSPRDGTANPRLAGPAVARAARVLGADIREGARVEAIERTGDGLAVRCAGGLAVESAFVVNAAGAWAPTFAEAAGEPVPLFAAGPPTLVTEPLPYFIRPTLQAIDGTVIFRQVARGNVVASFYPRGASDPVANRAPVAPAKIVTGLRRLAEVVPALAHAQAIRVWSGIEGYMTDMLPVLGPSGTTPGLVHAFGFCGHGFQLSPGVGATVADLVVDGRSSVPIEPFAIGRFKGTAPTASDKLFKEFDGALLATRPKS